MYELTFNLLFFVQHKLYWSMHENRD